MNKNRSDKIVSLLLAEYPNAVPDLNFRGPYELAVSVALSARTTDVQVNRVTPQLFEKYPSFESLACAEINDVEQIIKSVGFYHTKSKNIIGLASTVVKSFNGALPSTMDELTTLPGVGRKTANVILSVAFGQPAFAVDTHVSRIALRIGYCETRDPVKVEQAVISIVDKKFLGQLHLAMIKHGRAVCRPRGSLCGECCVRKLCASAGNVSK